MSTLHHVLVALDEEHSADGAFAFALDLRRNFGCELSLCTAIDRAAVTAAAVTPDGAVANVQAILDDRDAAARRFLASGIRTAGAAATTLLLEGKPGPAVVQAAIDGAVDAIVIGTHGRTGLERMLLGSTAESVLRMTTVPTFVVREPRDTVPPAVPCGFARIFVAIDDSEPSDAAIAFATRLAADKRATLLVCNVLDTGEMIDRALSYGYDPDPLVASVRRSSAELIDAKSQDAVAAGLTVERIIVEGDAPQAILSAAREHAADLIVVGTHGRRGLRRLFIGSVAEAVVRRSALPVAVVRTMPGHGA